MTNTNIMRLLGLTAILCLLPFATKAFAVTESAPTLDSVTAVSDTQIDLSWTPAGDGGEAITGYMIERNLNGGGFAVLVADTGSAVTTYSDTTLSAGDQADYRISTINASGTSLPSNVLGATTFNVPDQVTGLTATAIAAAQISLSWTAPADNGSPITGYMIERNLNGGGFAVLEANTGSTSTTYTDISTVNGDSAIYRVSAINGIGTGPTSATASAIADGISPTVTLSSTAIDPTNTSPIPMTAQFSETVTGFLNGDIVVGNGVAGNFVVVDGDTYTFDVTPSGDGLVTVDVAGGVASDAAGNTNTAATQFSITFDSANPTVFLSSTSTNPTGTSPIPMTAQFSETVTGFLLGDITIGNGIAGNFVAVDGDTYTFDVTPSADGLVTVDIGAGVAVDGSGNGNTAAVQLTRTFDTAFPIITILGENPVSLEYGTAYTDAGATATDTLDGDLTGSIVTVNTVDTIIGGYAATSYTVIYEVTDSNGNTAHAERIVNVGGKPTFGDYCTGDCIPPTIGLDSNGRRMVDWPVIYHTSTVDFRQLAEYFHTPMNDFTVNVGDINTLMFTVYDNSGFDAIRQIGLSIGVPFSGTFNDGAAQLRWYAAPLGQTVGDNTSYIEETDPNNVFELKSFDTERVECNPHTTGNNNCMGVTVKYIFREAPKDTAVRLDIWDEKRNAFQHVLNEGVTVKGDSMNGPDVFTAMANDGRMYTLTTDNDFATDQNGDRWSLVDNFWAKDLKPVINALDDARELAKDQQENIAKQLFDGSKLQKTIAPVKDYTPEHYDRLHDPVPNMIKAYIDYAKAKAGHS